MFQCFRQVRDDPTPGNQAKLKTLNTQCIIATNNVVRAAGDFGFESEVNDWTQEQQTVDEIYEEIDKRSQDTKLQHIISDILKFQGAEPGQGLKNLKVRLYSLSPCNDPIVTFNRRYRLGSRI